MLKEDVKRKLFQEELNSIRNLTKENKKVAELFLKKKKNATRFTVDTKVGKVIFYVHSDKINEGSLHVLLKHYKGVGNVTVKEILNFLDVVRFGKVELTNNHIIYKWNKKNVTYTLIVVLKNTNRNSKLIFKSFYSNRKK